MAYIVHIHDMDLILCAGFDGHPQHDGEVHREPPIAEFCSFQPVAFRRTLHRIFFFTAPGSMAVATRDRLVLGNLAFCVSSALRTGNQGDDS